MTTFNIGLNNNPRTVEEIVSMVNAMAGRKHKTYRVEQGEYKNEAEPTLVLRYDSERLDLIDLEKLCVWAEQEGIAVKRNKLGILAMHPEYKGEPIEFNDKYFIP